MDLRRLRPAEWVMTAGAAALVVALFLPWYELPSTTRLDAWEAFTAVDVILFACAAVGLLAVFLQATQDTPALPVVASVAATWAGLPAVVLVLVNALDRSDRFTASCYGLWVGLAGAVAMLAGAWWATRDERTGLRAGRSHLESSG